MATLSGTQRRVLSLIAAGVWLPLLLACSGSGSTPDPEPGGLEDGGFDPVEGVEQGDQTLLSPEDIGVIDRARERSIQQCMAEHGFNYESVAIRYYIESPPTYLSPQEMRRTGYQYDWANEAESFLALNGPDGPPSPTMGMTAEQVESFDRAMSGDLNDTVELEDLGGGTVGVPRGGCSGEARTELFGTVENSVRFDRAVENVNGRGFSAQLRRMDDYQASLDDWQSCMRSAAHDIEESDDYGYFYLLRLQDTSLAAGNGPLSDEEIGAVANDDADCLESSGLFEVRRELLPEAMDRVANELGFGLGQYAAFQHAVLERAKNVP